MNRVQKAAVIIITLLLVVLGTAYGAGYFYLVPIFCRVQS